MRRYHIHVYLTERMGHIDVRAENEEQARGLAIELVTSGQATIEPSDCSWVAVLPFAEKEGAK